MMLAVRISALLRGYVKQTQIFGIFIQQIIVISVRLVEQVDKQA
jgi:hypothetical protein